MVTEAGLPPIPKKAKLEGEFVHEYADKYARQPEEIPNEEHWAIVTGSAHTGSYGDTEHHLEYEVYLTKEKWLSQIEYKLFGPSYGYRAQFKALHVLPAQLITKVVVK